jgi:hypothetical protein
MMLASNESFGSVAYAHRQNPAKTVFSPFFTVFPAGPNRDSLDETRVAPFSELADADRKR